MTFDLKEFNSLMNIQKNRSKTASILSNEEWNNVNEFKETEFIGYDELISESNILRYRKSKNKKGEINYQVIFDKTPFYAEGGGQIGDSGTLDSNINIFNTIKENDTIIHLMDSLPKDLTKTFKLSVNKSKRLSSSSNHTATHLLHQALRSVLGDHVQQKGSMVSDKYLRFDFYQFSNLTERDIEKVE